MSWYCKQVLLWSTKYQYLVIPKTSTDIRLHILGFTNTWAKILYDKILVILYKEHEEERYETKETKDYKVVGIEGKMIIFLRLRHKKSLNLKHTWTSLITTTKPHFVLNSFLPSFVPSFFLQFDFFFNLKIKTIKTTSFLPSFQFISFLLNTVIPKYIDINRSHLSPSHWLGLLVSIVDDSDYLILLQDLCSD